jgi:hypothetical protein
MSDIVYARLIAKSGEGPPTVPPSPSHDSGDWIETDVYPYELYVDLLTDKVYIGISKGFEMLNPDNKDFNWTVDLMDSKTVDIYAPFGLSINNFYNIVNASVVDIQLNDAPYTLLDPIAQGDKITISVDVFSVINIQGTYE